MIKGSAGGPEAFIRSLPAKDRYEPGDLLVPELLLDREGEIEMYYAPHNEYVNASARLVIVGITPGWSQMELAIRTAKRAWARNAPDREAYREAKLAARFAGAMRANLLRMLSELKVHRYLGLPDAEALFAGDCPQLHTTSLLRCPVFVAGRNYNGHKPPLTGSAFLRRYAYESIVRELGELDEPLIIPLGRTVENVFRQLVEEKKAVEERIVWGFPHPSGANGHRHAQFERARDAMERKLAAFDWQAGRGGERR